MRVFIDTSAFIALLIPSQQWHAACVRKYQGYVKHGALFFTNTLVLAELYTRLMYDLGSATCRRVMKHINKLQEEGALRVFQVDAVDFSEAQKVMLRFGEHTLSLTDASIYAAVRLYDLDEVFTLDSDFRKIGLRDGGLR